MASITTCIMKTAVRRLASSRAVVSCLVALTVLVVADGLLTNALVRHGIAHESNPLLEVLVGGNWLIAIKGIGAAACSLILWDVYCKWRALGLVGAYGALAFYTAVVIWNAGLLVNSLLS